MSASLSPRPSYSQGFARSAGESAYPQSWAGLIGAWNPALGPTGITTLMDVSGFGNDGSMESILSTAWAVSNNSRVPGYSLFFDNSPDLIDIGINSFDLGIVRHATYMAWMTTTGGPNETLISDFNSNIGMALRVENNDEYTAFVYPGNHRINTTGLSLAGWHHYTLVLDGANMFGYVDGIEIGTQTLAEDIGDSAENIKIGSRGDESSTNFLLGELQDIRIYLRAMQPAEVYFNYTVPMAPFRLRSLAGIKSPVAITDAELIGPRQIGGIQPLKILPQVVSY